MVRERAAADRAAIRLLLVLQQAPLLRERIAALEPPPAGIGWRQRLALLMARAVELLGAPGETSADHPGFRLPPLPGVPWRGWLVPAALLSGVVVLDQWALA